MLYKHKIVYSVSQMSMINIPQIPFVRNNYSCVSICAVFHVKLYLALNYLHFVILIIFLTSLSTRVKYFVTENWALLIFFFFFNFPLEYHHIFWQILGLGLLVLWDTPKALVLNQKMPWFSLIKLSLEKWSNKCITENWPGYNTGIRKINYVSMSDIVPTGLTTSVTI